MTLLSVYDEDWLSSTNIAGSLNINPVLVRNELVILKEGGLIESKEGKNGGVRLLKPASKIFLSDIFNLVKGNDTVLSLLKNTPNPNCTVGKQINDKLTIIMGDIDHAISKELEKITLETFKSQF